MLPLLAMILVFTLPMFIGWYLYMNPELLSGKEKVNGLLIEPPRSMKQVVLSNLDGDEITISELQGKWLLLLVVDGVCDRACNEAANAVLKVERALGRDRGRVEALMLGDGKREKSAPATTRIRVFSAKDKRLNEKILSLTEISGGMGLFIVDPMGNLMLGYGSSIEGIKILEDIKKLLTATKNWNQGCAVCPAIN